MNTKLMDKRVAFLATNGVEESELQSPLDAVKAAGATTEIISTKPGQIQAQRSDEKGAMFPVDRTTGQVSVDDYDALVIPGGTKSPDRLRLDTKAVDFVRQFVQSGKPVASICHGPWMFVEAGVLKGRTVTSWPSLRTDIENAGGTWVDQEVHVKDGIVTSRKPEDLPAFNKKLVEEIAEGTHTARTMREPMLAGSAR